MRATQPLKHTCKRIYFIRHGQSEANALKDSNATAKFQDGKYMGNPSDIPEVRDAKLTALGRAQAACWHRPNALAAVFQDVPPEVVKQFGKMQLRPAQEVEERQEARTANGMVHVRGL